MKKILLLLITCLFIIETNAQNKSSKPEKIYSVNRKVEIPVTVGLFALSSYGFYHLSQKPALDTLEILALDQHDVPAFDRGVFSQSHPPPSSIYTISDIGL